MQRSGALIVFTFFLLGFLFSLWYLEAYYMGDQRAYKLYYDSLFQMPSSSWITFQRQHLGSSEPLYGYVIGPFAYWGANRIVYLSLWNGLLIACIGHAMVKYRCSVIFSLFVLSNYYLLVAVGPAERLKFAYICLILAFSLDSMKVKLLLTLISPLFHAQAIIQLVSGVGYYLASNLFSFLRMPLKSIAIVLVSALSFAILAYAYIGWVGQSIEAKSAIYSEASGGLSEAIQWAMLLIGGLIAFRRRLAYFVGMMPMGVMTILFGNRVNIATFALFVAVAMVEKKTKSPIVLVVMAYMSYKSIGFMSDVIRYGDGFVS